MKEIPAVTGGGGSDGPPPGVEAWKAETKAIERVIEIALTLDRPRTAEWVSEQAAVAEQTARDHLDSLVDLGVVTETTARGVTRYQLDRAYKRFREVSSYVEKFEKGELMDLVASTQEDIESTRERYGVEVPDELRAKAAEDGTSPEQVREYKKAASEFESLIQELDIMEEALERYDEFSRTEAAA
jgi:predicted ArsR family transcriptional regulator